MEKQGKVSPMNTKDVEGKLAGTKTASAQSQTEVLDNDTTKRMAAAFAKPGK